jgi:hypothetical protein
MGADVDLLLSEQHLHGSLEIPFGEALAIGAHGKDPRRELGRLAGLRDEATFGNYLVEQGKKYLLGGALDD